jgi:Signal transduction histidine kinase
MKILKAFLKDHILDFVGYASILILILVYYRLEIGKPIPILYPVFLVIFVSAVITLIKGIRYFSFYAALKSGSYAEYRMTGASELSIECIHKIEEIHRYYNLELNRQQEQKNQTYAFIAQMVHDMKIPISVIRLIVEDAEKQQMTGSELINDRIKTENDKLLDKLSQLLCYLRLGQFEKDYLIEQADLVAEVRNEINNKKEYFIVNQIYPKVTFAETSVPVLTDKKWNGMLLGQIISNAVKYSALKSGANSIRFDISQFDRYVELTITDFGIGIPEYDIERIYEPFFTGENGRKVQNSSGIGLYLCKTIAEKLGHTLTIYSVKGKGTTVKLRYLSKM